MKIIVTVFICQFFTLCTNAQSKKDTIYKYSCSLTTENDSYLLQKKDAYYTNGIYFQYRNLKKKQNGK